jgi:hypothetical protein
MCKFFVSNKISICTIVKNIIAYPPKHQNFTNAIDEKVTIKELADVVSIIANQSATILIIFSNGSLDSAKARVSKS